MKPRTLEEAMKAMDEAEALVDELRAERDTLWLLLSAAERAATQAVADFHEFTARHREAKQ